MKFISSASYPVITFGPFASPSDVLVSFSRAVGKITILHHGCINIFKLRRLGADLMIVRHLYLSFDKHLLMFVELSHFEKISKTQ